jgi:hypothetical protein
MDRTNGSSAPSAAAAPGGARAVHDRDRDRVQFMDAGMAATHELAVNTP